MRERGEQIAHPGLDVKSFKEREGAVPFGVGFVGQLHTRFLSPEKIGTHGDITLGGKAVAKRTHHGVDAEDFLDHHKAGTVAALGQRGITAEVGAIERAYGDVGHEELLKLVVQQAGERQKEEQ